MNSELEMLTKKLQMLASAQIMNEQKVPWLKLWNQFNVLKEVVKFAKHDKWLHKATFYS
jgi:hypothetical protein